jgi:hypothetical protein
VIPFAAQQNRGGEIGNQQTCVKAAHEWR